MVLLRLFRLALKLETSGDHATIPARSATHAEAQRRLWRGDEGPLALFRRIDADSDGYLSTKELSELLVELVAAPSGAASALQPAPAAAAAPAAADAAEAESSVPGAPESEVAFGGAVEVRASSARDEVETLVSELDTTGSGRLNAVEFIRGFPGLAIRAAMRSLAETSPVRCQNFVFAHLMPMRKALSLCADGGTVTREQFDASLDELVAAVKAADAAAEAEAEADAAAAAAKKQVRVIGDDGRTQSHGEVKKPAPKAVPKAGVPVIAPPKEFAIPPPPSAELLHELAQQVPVNGSGALQYEAFFDALHVVDCDRLSQVV